MEAGASVDEKRKPARFIETPPIVLHVMEHRGVLIHPDDVGVRKLLFRRICGAQIFEMNLVLGPTAAERSLGGAMAARANPVRPAHALDLVLRLPGALEMQLV